MLRFPQLLLSLILVIFAAAHEPGAEFTYLSMFVKKRNDKASLPTSTSLSSYSPQSFRKRRRLHESPRNVASVPAIDYEADTLAESQSDEWRQSSEDWEPSEDGEPRVRLQHGAKVAVKDSGKDLSSTGERGEDKDGNDNVSSLEKESDSDGGEVEDDGESTASTKGEDDSAKSNVQGVHGEENDGVEESNRDGDSGDTEDDVEADTARTTEKIRPVLGATSKMQLPPCSAGTKKRGSSANAKSERNVSETKGKFSSPKKKNNDLELEEDLQPLVKEGERNGEDIQRLSYMLMKLLKQYNVNSLVDVPCRAHSHWMPIFLKHAAARRKDKLLYYCVDTNREILKSIKERVGDEVIAKFKVIRFWKENLPKSDVVFSWGGLDNMRGQNVLKYVRKLGRSGNRHQLVMISSHSGSLKEEGSKDIISRYTMGGDPINLRREPFDLNSPYRIVGNLSKGKNDRQLYIYKPNEMLPERKRLL